MVTRFAPFKEPEFEYMESFLEDMATKGLLLDKYGLLYAYFRESEPCNRRYRIVPKIWSDVNEEELFLYEGAGWNYAGKKACSGLNIFYTDDPKAPEIFTDMKSFRVYARKFAAVGIISVLLVFLILYVVFGTAKGMLDLFGIVQLLDGMGLIFAGAMLAALLLLVALAEALILSRFSIMYRILAAKPIRHNIEYRGKLRFHIATLIAAVILVGVLLIGDNFTFQDTSNKTTMLSYSGNHPVSYEIVDPDGWNKIETAMETWEWNDNIGFDVFTDPGILFDEKREVHVDIGSSYWRAIYMEAKSEKIAEKWLAEEILYDTNSVFNPDDIALDTPDGLDYLGYYIDEYEDQIVYMRKGNVVERICYFGGKDIRQYIDEFVEDILL